MADVQLTLTVPDAYVTRVLAAMNHADGRLVEVSVGDAAIGDNYGFTTAIEKGGMGNAEYAKYFIMQLIKTYVRAYEFGVDRVRFESEQAAVTPATQNVPDEIVG